MLNYLWEPRKCNDFAPCDHRIDRMFMTRTNLTDHIPGQGSRHECKPIKALCFVLIKGRGCERGRT
jgi:hypothetical protein